MKQHYEMALSLQQKALDFFGQNLEVFFIGGSVAKKEQRLDSDIDCFVLTKESDRGQEERYFEFFKEMHISNGLELSHFGEVFDRQTLVDLLLFTTGIPSAYPEIRTSSCYTADCIYSVFRKGVVVLGFLRDPKILVYDPKLHIPKLEKLANKFFRTARLPILCPDNGGNIEKDIISHGKQLLKAGRLENTPVGIGLKRWFRHPFGNFSANGEEVFFLSSNNFSTQKGTTCPLLSQFSKAQQDHGHEYQCLASAKNARYSAPNRQALKI